MSQRVKDPDISNWQIEGGLGLQHDWEELGFADHEHGLRGIDMVRQLVRGVGGVGGGVHTPGGDDTQNQYRIVDL